MLADREVQAPLLGAWEPGEGEACLLHQRGEAVRRVVFLRREGRFAQVFLADAETAGSGRVWVLFEHLRPL